VGLGNNVGILVGREFDGGKDGQRVGLLTVGKRVGCEVVWVGLLVGLRVGFEVTGLNVGLKVGFLVGLNVGLLVGFFVVVVGAGISISTHVAIFSGKPNMRKIRASI